MVLGTIDIMVIGSCILISPGVEIGASKVMHHCVWRSVK